MLVNGYEIGYRVYQEQNDKLKAQYNGVIQKYHIDDIRKNETSPMMDIVTITGDNGANTCTVVELVTQTFNRLLYVSNPSFLENWKGWRFQTKTSIT